MTDRTIVAFLPCRAGSQRVPEKNIRPFAGVEGGLARIKINQLLAAPEIDIILVSTDDAKVVEIAREAQVQAGDRLQIAERPAHLATSLTSTDELIAHIPSLVGAGHVLWTHVTSPFVDAARYSALIAAYWAAIAAGSHDSLMTVTRLQTFLWNENGPINYDREVEKWPRTQTLPPIYEVNSAAFLAPIETYREQADRIGKRPLLFELNGVATLDIDWPDDFELAETIWRGL